jgi:RimJ/RimL family protein N-acetyltransferase
LCNLHAYAVEDELQVELKGERRVLVRPSTSIDSAGIRELFHQLTDRDRYTCFFRKVRGLSDRDVQRLCNLDFDNEVAFVAAAGECENPQIVAQAGYFIDPGTNLAETAFMVHPQWQGSGLGTALQQRMAEHVRRRGVRGFVAEILADNEKMIRLARRRGARCRWCRTQRQRRTLRQHAARDHAVPIDAKPAAWAGSAGRRSCRAQASSAPPPPWRSLAPAAE